MIEWLETYFAKKTLRYLWWPRPFLLRACL
jgi:hypothetical protein